MNELDCFLLHNDNRKVKGTWTQAIKWMEEDFMPRMVKQGLKKIAFTYSPEKSARYSVDRLLEVNDGYEGQTFDDFETAVSWLLGELTTMKIKPEEAFLVLHTKERKIRIPLESISYVSSHNGQSVVQTQTEQYVTRYSLSDLMKKLPQPQFYRIHKSHIVNIQKVIKLKYHAGGYYHLFLKDFGKVYLTVSRNRVKELKEVLNNSSYF